MQISLAQHVKHIRCLKESVAQMDKEIALNLAQTQGAFLTSVRGIGLVLAAGVTAEIGDLNQQKPLNWHPTQVLSPGLNKLEAPMARPIRVQWPSAATVF